MATWVLKKIEMFLRYDQSNTDDKTMVMNTIRINTTFSKVLIFLRWYFLLAPVEGIIWSFYNSLSDSTIKQRYRRPASYTSEIVHTRSIVCMEVSGRVWHADMRTLQLSCLTSNWISNVLMCYLSSFLDAYNVCALLIDKSLVLLIAVILISETELQVILCAFRINARK